MPTDKEQQFKALREGDKMDFWGNDNPKCPHCGKKCEISTHDWYKLYEEGEHEVACPFCDEDFEVSTYVHYSFSTDRQGDM